MAQKVWLITGASSGFGLAMAKCVLENGDIAIATLRTPNAITSLVAAYSDTQLLVIKMDVTNASDVNFAFTRGLEKFGRIDVVFNNAGIIEVREIETEEQEDVARGVMEVNFWGAMRVMREAVKAFRDGNPPGTGGVLLNISSYAGTAPLTCAGFYTASKHALQGLSTTLAKELLPEWNIKVCIVELGAFRTPIYDSSPILPVHPKYDVPNSNVSLVRIMRNDMQSAFYRGMSDVDVGVKVLHDLVGHRDVQALPLFVLLGSDAVDVVRTALLEHLSDVERVCEYGGDLMPST